MKYLILFRFCKNTNFESNSQPVKSRFVSQTYCLDSAKIQILKAIHNRIRQGYSPDPVVLILQKYKF